MKQPREQELVGAHRILQRRENSTLCTGRKSYAFVVQAVLHPGLLMGRESSRYATARARESESERERKCVCESEWILKRRERERESE